MTQLAEPPTAWTSTAQGIEVGPRAPALMHSLRAVGYDTPAAIADLVDNSIAAGAHKVEIIFSSAAPAFVAVVDDGAGMSQGALIEAMRFGSRDPRDARSQGDLGRFGLGLKTASLSQCRRLSVASLTTAGFAAGCWDLDECDRRGTWWLEIPDVSTVREEVINRLRAHGRGTAVVWERIDRTCNNAAPAAPVELEPVMSEAADRLALVFHRFLAGEFGRGFDISVNGRSLPRMDPFLAGHVRGQTLHEETFEIDGHTVRVSPFVLPMPSRIKADDLDRAGGRERLKSSHGFYIYRGGRLVVPGGWFRIVPTDELVRLARIRVDVPVELDHIWNVDIRKTQAEPPPALRPHLRRIVGAARARSRLVYEFRGTPVNEAAAPVWKRHALRDDAAAWRIDRAHPVLRALLATVPPADLESALRLIEESVPLRDIYIHQANDLPLATAEPADEAELAALANRLVAAFADQPGTLARYLDTLHTLAPFDRAPEVARRIAARLRA